MVSPKYKGKRIEVVWLDAASHPSWQHMGTTIDLSEIVTVGLYVQHDKRKFLVALNRDEQGTHGDVIAIPTAQVKKIKVLR